MIYLASPYSAFNSDGSHDTALEELRYKQTVKVLKDFMLLGFVLYSPIAHWHQVNVEFPGEISHDLYLEADLEILSRCDGMYVLQLDGWETSKGVSREIEFANKLDMPVVSITP